MEPGYDTSPGVCLLPTKAFSVCAVPPQLLPRLLQAQQFKCPHCRTTQGLPEGLGVQQEAQLMSAAPERVNSQAVPVRRTVAGFGGPGQPPALTTVWLCSGLGVRVLTDHKMSHPP